MDEELLAKLRLLASGYSQKLKARTDERIEEMNRDDNSHFLIYRILVHDHIKEWDKGASIWSER